MSNLTTPTPSELAQVERANRSGKQPVVFVHGLWLLDSSWDRWAAFFEAAGYTAVTPGWPDDPDERGRRARGPGRVRGQERRRRRRRTSSRSSSGWTGSRRSSATRSAACSR